MTSASDSRPGRSSTGLVELICRCRFASRCCFASRESVVLLSIMCVAVLLGSGCSRDGLVQVTGKVTLDGKPVTTGRVDFFPEEGRPSSGAIGEDGQYQLTTFTLGDGAKPGKYIVTITAHVGVDDEPQYASMDDELNGVPSNAGQGNGSQQARWLVPQRYSSRSSSGLTAEVGDRRAYDFPLKSKL